MAHFPKPFFRSARNAWFVQISDRQVKLAADKDETFTRYHELMAKPSLPQVTQAEAQKLVVVIVDEFLDWCEKHRAPTAGTRTGSILSSRRLTPRSPSLISNRTMFRSGWTITAFR